MRSRNFARELVFVTIPTKLRLSRTQTFSDANNARANITTENREHSVGPPTASFNDVYIKWLS